MENPRPNQDEDRHPAVPPVLARLSRTHSIQPTSPEVRLVLRGNGERPATLLGRGDSGRFRTRYRPVSTTPGSLIGDAPVLFPDRILSIA